MNKFLFHMPTKVYFGKGEFLQCAGKIKEVSTKAVILTGKNSALKNGSAVTLKKLLNDKNIEAEIISGISTNPEREYINTLSKQIKNRFDSIIAMGGGSVIDAGKAVAVMAKSESEDIWDFVMHSGKKPKKVLSALPLIAIPTVASTGSETNGLAVISSDKENAKLELFSEHLFPKIAIIDPLLTETVPENIKVAGAADIFSHAMEAYLSSSLNYSPIDDGFAETIMKSVLLSIKDRNNIDIETLSWAAGLPLTGITSTLRTGPFPLHIMEHVLSSFTGIHHGTGLVFLLPFYLERIKNERPERFASFCRNVFSENGDSVLEKISDIFKIEVECLKSIFKDTDAALMAERAISVYGNRFGNIGLKCFDYDGVFSVFTRFLQQMV